LIIFVSVKYLKSETASVVMLMVRVLPLCVVDRRFHTPVDRRFRTPVDRRFRTPVDRRFRTPVDRRFHLRSVQSNNNNTGVFCFSPNHAAIMNKSKNWLDQNQDNASDWSDIVIPGLLFQL
jgi:hypothetical protein